MVVVVADRAVEMRDTAGMDFLGAARRMVGNVRWYLNRRHSAGMNARGMAQAVPLVLCAIVRMAQPSMSMR